MFNSNVGVLGSEGMKQELLGRDGILEAIEQAAPAQVMMKVLGGDPVKPNHPALQAAVVGIHILNVPDAIASRPVVARHKPPRCKAQVGRDAPVTGIAVGA